MREDSQLICPIAYDDPANIWNLIEKGLHTCNPLRDVTWKSQRSSSLITIAKLPIKFLPGTSSLFKDSDHPYRYFLAPYIHLYIVVAETMESYKSQRSTIKQWVSNIKQAQRSAWLLLFVPTAKQPIDVYQKIYSTISSEFYKERAGDRTCMLNLSTLSSTAVEGVSSIARRAAFSNDGNNLRDLCLKMSDSIVQSFKLRCVMYDTEIRRLDEKRNTPNLEFRELFLVKESLALMYQMMQLPGEALVQYEEIEALLAFAPKSIKDIGGWPIFDSTDPFGNDGSSSSSSSGSGVGAVGAANGKVNDRDSSNINNIGNGEKGGTGDTDAGKEKSDTNQNQGAESTWSWLCQEGDGLLHYSINTARMRILKNRIGLLELHRYIFARECYFLYGLGRPASCVEKGNVFISFVRKTISKRIDSRKDSTTKYSEFTATECLYHDQIEKWRSLLDFWVVIASVKLVRSCTEFVLGGSIQNGGPEKDESPSFGKISEKMRECSPFIGELLQLATSRLLSLVSYNSKMYIDRGGTNNGKSNNGSGSSGVNELGQKSQIKIESAAAAAAKEEEEEEEEEMYQRPLQYFRRSAHAMVSKLRSWNEMDNIKSIYPDTFSVKECGSSTSTDDNSTMNAFKRIIKEDIDIDSLDKRKDKKVNFMNISKELTHFSRFLTEMMMIDYLSSPIKTEVNDGVADDEPNSSSLTTTDSTGDWIKKEKRRRDFAAELISLLTLLLAEHEDLAGRQRFACQTKSQCADVLIVQGKFSMAQQLLLSALANICNSAHSAGETTSSNLTPTEILENTSVLSTIWSGSKSIDSFRHINKSDCISILQGQNKSASGNNGDNDNDEVNFMGRKSVNVNPCYWRSLRYWILRKLLFCSCFLDARTTYAQVALSLLALDGGASLNDPDVGDWHSTLLSDVLFLTQKSESSEPRSQIYHSLSPFFETSIMNICDVMSSNGDDNSGDADGNTAATIGSEKVVGGNIASSKLIESNQTIRDDTYRVFHANYECGKRNCIALKLCSHLHADVELNLQPHEGEGEEEEEDALYVGYGQFHSSMVQCSTSLPSSHSQSSTNESMSNSSLHATLSHIKSWMTDDSGNGFCAYPVIFDSKDDDDLVKLRKLKIHRGEQLILMEMQPGKPDDYSALYVSLKIGGVTFVDIILPPKPDEMPTYFDSHRLLTFSVPPNIIRLEATAPAFTPMFYDDSIVLSWSPEDGDQIVSIVVAAKVNLRSNDKSGQALASLVTVGSSPDHGFTIIVGDLSEWKLKKKVATTTTSKDEGNDGYLEIPHQVQDGLFKVDKLSGNASETSGSQYQLSIPFIISNAKDFYTSEATLPSLTFEISCYVEFVLKRNGCLIENSTSASCTVHTGRAAQVTCHSDGLYMSMDNSGDCTDIISGDFFACCTFKNCSPLSLMLSTYNSLPPILPDISEETFGAFELCSVNGEVITSCNMPVLLEPLDEYHITVRLVFKHGNTASIDRDPRGMDKIWVLKNSLIPRIGFEYSRFDKFSTGCVAFNEMTFREDADIMLPEIVLPGNTAQTVDQHPAICLKHSHFSIRATPNIESIGRKGIDTSNGIIVSINCTVSFSYQVRASFILHPDHALPPQLIVQLLPVEHWIPLGETVMYLDPMGGTTDSNVAVDKDNSIGSSYSSWNFAFNCQFISTCYGETRPPAVFVKLAPSSLSLQHRNCDEISSRNGRENFVNDIVDYSASTGSPIYIHTSANLQPEAPLLYICSCGLS